MFKPRLSHKLILAIAMLAFASLLLHGCSSASKQKVMAREPSKSVEKAEIKKCQLTPPKGPVACTMQYDPVCGCDGKTYGNACGARGAGVPHSTPGACGAKVND